jgi:signal transduction histidine kinase
VALAGGISLGVEAGPTVSIVGDDDLLLQMLLNLLDNAVKYTPAGGAITAGWRAVDGSVEIFVSDTGAGIAPEHLPHVFDRFYRADPSRSRTAGGAGLGLSIARWIAEAHGGSMTAESVPGEGSTFTARLPLS